MKRLTCEMCGSTELIKQDGVFVCQSCGTKYSVEEARKMMVEVEGTVDVSGSTVKVDNTGELENYRKLAIAAFDAGNYGEALKYANQVLELDSEDYLCHYMKGTSTAWQTTTARPRLEEAVQYWTKALEKVPLETEEAEKLCKNIARDYCRATVGLKSLYVQQIRDQASMSRNHKACLALNPARLKNCIMMQIAYNQRLPQEQRKGAVSNYLSEGNDDLPYSVYKQAFDKIEESTHRSIRIFAGGNMSESCKQQLMFYMQIWLLADQLPLQQQAQGYDYALKEYKQTEQVLRSSQFTTGIVTQMTDLVRKSKDEAEQKVRKKKEEERKKRIEDYWKEHAGEKESLENEKNQLAEEKNLLNTKISEIEKKINSVPAVAERDNLQNEIRSLRQRRDSLGIFKGKEKKALQAQIETMEKKVDDVIKQVQAQQSAFEPELKPLRERIREINSRTNEIANELKKDR